VAARTIPKVRMTVLLQASYPSIEVVRTEANLGSITAVCRKRSLGVVRCC
jgi:hypothetical protein